MIQKYSSYLKGVIMTKKLYRSQTDTMIAGVCGGLAEYFDIDPVIVRIGFLILLLSGGLPGFVPYVILWIIVPLTPNADIKKST